MERISSVCQKITTEGRCTVRQLSRIIGMMSATTLAVLPAPMCFRALQWLSLCQYTVLRDSSGSKQASHGGTKLVDISTPVLEWKTHSSSYFGHHNRIRCFATALESSIGDNQFKRIMVRGRENPTHQHAGADGRAFAIRIFTKGRQNIHVRLRMYNTTAIAYVNHMGGTKSQSLSQAACKLWQWCLSERHYSNSRAPTRSMQHIGRLRVEDAAVISGVDVGQLNLWQSTTEVGSMRFRPLCIQIEQSVAEVSKLAPRSIRCGNTCIPDVVDKGTRVRLSRIALIGKSLQKVRQEGSSLVLIAPTWSTQHWYPILLETLIDYPVPLLVDQSLLWDLFNRPHSLLLRNQLQLAAWKVSGPTTLQRDFQSMLQLSSYQDGARELTLPTSQPGVNGTAGVWQSLFLRCEVFSGFPGRDVRKGATTPFH